MKDGRVKNFSDVPDCLQIKPKDTFSGKDFEYEKDADGFILRCRSKDLGKNEILNMNSK